MINKRLAILMAGQKKQSKDPMVGKWVYVRYNSAYITAGFTIPKVYDQTTTVPIPETGAKFKTYRQNDEISIASIRFIGSTSRPTINNVVFSVNPFASGSAYGITSSAQYLDGSSYIVITEEFVNELKNISPDAYSSLYVCLTMTHVKE